MIFTIDKAKPADAEAILEFSKKCGAETDNLSFGAEGIAISVEKEAEFIESFENSDKGIYLVARIDKEIIGTANYLAFSKSRLQHRGEFGISVRKPYWNLGVGTGLLKSIIRFAKETAKSEIISLGVRSDNKAAIHLYKKLGFEKIGTFKGYFKINGILVDCDIMELYL